MHVCGCACVCSRTWMHISLWSCQSITALVDRCSHSWYGNFRNRRPIAICCLKYNFWEWACRELSNRLYNFSAYFIAKSLTSLPFQLLFTTVFTFIVYFMVGYQVSTLVFGSSLNLQFSMLTACSLHFNVRPQSMQCLHIEGASLCMWAFLWSRRIKSNLA